MSIAVILVVVAMLPVVVLLLPGSPAHIGLKPHGAVASARLRHATETRSASRLRVCAERRQWTHQHASDRLCGDHGIPAVNSATMLAIIGGFSLIGSAASGWLCDRFNPRFLRTGKIPARRPDRNRAGRRAGKDRPPRPRTEISNPSSSSGESANFQSLSACRLGRIQIEQRSGSGVSNTSGI